MAIPYYTFNSTGEQDIFSVFTRSEVEYQLADVMMRGNQSPYAEQQYQFNQSSRYVNPRRVLSILHMLGNGKQPQEVA